MRVNKQVCHVALQIIFCLTIIIPVLCLMSGCTIVINSHDVTTATETTNALLGGL